MLWFALGVRASNSSQENGILQICELPPRITFPMSHIP